MKHLSCQMPARRRLLLLHRLMMPLAAVRSPEVSGAVARRGVAAAEAPDEAAAGSLAAG